MDPSWSPMKSSTANIQHMTNHKPSANSKNLPAYSEDTNPLTPIRGTTAVMQQIGQDLARVCMDDDPDVKMENDTSSTERMTRHNEPELTGRGGAHGRQMEAR